MLGVVVVSILGLIPGQGATALGVELIVLTLITLAGVGGGLLWVVAGIVGALLGGVMNAWVLLVEIQR